MMKTSSKLHTAAWGPARAGFQYFALEDITKLVGHGQVPARAGLSKALPWQGLLLACLSLFELKEGRSGTRYLLPGAGGLCLAGLWQESVCHNLVPVRADLSMACPDKPHIAAWCLPEAGLSMTFP